MDRPHTTQRSEAATNRIRALGAWRGPWSITLRDESGGLLRGWQVLSLAVRTARTHRIIVESRSVYANLADERETLAVLRAVYWNQAEAMAANASRHANRDAVSARFVRVPTSRVQAWIAPLVGQRVPMVEPWRQDDSSPIRSIRIDLNWISHIFEKSWQSTDEPHMNLNQIWLDIWDDMSASLTTDDQITDIALIEEAFRDMEGVPVYEIGDYETSRSIG